MVDITELEKVLLDQIEKLNDDSIMEQPEQAKMLIDRSNSISNLANSFISVQKTKLDVVKELNKNGGLYESYLGIKDDTKALPSNR